MLFLKGGQFGVLLVECALGFFDLPVEKLSCAIGHLAAGFQIFVDELLGQSTADLLCMLGVAVSVADIQAGLRPAASRRLLLSAG